MAATLDIWMKVGLALLLLSWAPIGYSIRPGELERTYEGILKNLASPSDSKASKNGTRLHSQGEDAIHRGEGPKDICNYGNNLVHTTESTFLPSGMPVFRVTFTNTCLGCFFHNIHISCGDFSSATVVDPLVFKRLANNDCLLVNGGPLFPQMEVSFEYVTTFAYPMTVARAITSGC